jgi:hypothetical protein
MRALVWALGVVVLSVSVCRVWICSATGCWNDFPRDCIIANIRYARTGQKFPVELRLFAAYLLIRDPGSGPLSGGRWPARVLRGSEFRAEFRGVLALTEGKRPSDTLNFERRESIMDGGARAAGDPRGAFGPIHERQP